MHAPATDNWGIHIPFGVASFDVWITKSAYFHKIPQPFHAKCCVDFKNPFLVAGLGALNPPGFRTPLCMVNLMR